MLAYMSTEVTTIRWHRAQAASFESAEYVAEYAGRRVQATRLTDPNDDGPYYGKSATVTRWDGWVEETDSTGRPYWSLVAECYGTRRAVTAVLVRWIARQG